MISVKTLLLPFYVIILLPIVGANLPFVTAACIPALLLSVTNPRSLLPVISGTGATDTAPLLTLATGLLRAGLFW